MSTRVSIVVTHTCVSAAVLRGRRIERREERGVRSSAALPDTAVLEDLAEAIIDTVISVNGIGLPADLIVPSTWCFHQTLESDKRLNKTAVAYQLEEYLPLPLEDVTCAFAPGGNGYALGLAVRTEPIRLLLDRLAEGRVFVGHIFADSLVAASIEADSGGAEVTGVLLLDEGRLAISLRLRNDSQPCLIRSLLVTGQSDLPAAIDLTEASAGVAAEHWTLLDLRSVPSENVTPDLLDKSRVDSQAHNQAIESLHCLVGRHGRELPDLCTGSLAPASRWDRTTRLATRCVVLAALMLLVWTGDLYRQKQEFTNATRLVQARQAEVYREALPGRKVPRNAAVRLASERVRLEGLTRSGDGRQQERQSVQDRHAALDTLRCFTAELPADVRLMLLDWRIDSTQLTARGRTADHRDAERIAEAVNRVPGLTARPPKTSRLKKGGVEFSIRAAREQHHGS